MTNKGKLEVRVIRDRCIGCGACEGVAEMIFKVNSSGISEVLTQDGTDEDKLLAGQSCPTDAIEVKDVLNGEVVWPKNKTEKGGE